MAARPSGNGKRFGHAPVAEHPLAAVMHIGGLLQHLPRRNTLGVRNKTLGPDQQFFRAFDVGPDLFAAPSASHLGQGPVGHGSDQRRHQKAENDAADQHPAGKVAGSGLHGEPP